MSKAEPPATAARLPTLDGSAVGRAGIDTAGLDRRDAAIGAQAPARPARPADRRSRTRPRRHRPGRRADHALRHRCRLSRLCHLDRRHLGRCHARQARHRHAGKCHVHPPDRHVHPPGRQPGRPARAPAGQPPAVVPRALPDPAGRDRRASSASRCCRSSSSSRRRSRPSPARRSGRPQPDRLAGRRRDARTSATPQPDMGHTHVTPGTKVTYTYCAPASGNHFNNPGTSGPIPARVYGPNDQVVPMGWIHNLEHGGLVILYQGTSAGATPEGQAAFKAVLRRVPAGADCGPVIARFDQMSSPFQALVWGRVLPARHVRPGADPRPLQPMGRQDQPRAAVPDPEQHDQPERHGGAAGRRRRHRAAAPSGS